MPYKKPEMSSSSFEENDKKHLPMPFFIIFPILLYLFFTPTNGHAQSERHYCYSDAHIHFVNFFQRSEGIQALLAAMDQSCIDHVMLTGLPVTKKWDENEPKEPRYVFGDDAPTYWYSASDVIVAEAVKDLPQAHRQRIHPFISAFNPNDMNAVDHIERMIRLYPGLWEGIGEVMTRHDDLTALNLGNTVRADSGGLPRVYELAARLEMPVMIHSNVTSQREHEPLYVEEMTRSLNAYPNTKFIWAHAGVSMVINRRMKLDFMVKLLDLLLKKHDNLYIDLSWSLLNHYLLDENGNPDGEWLELIEKYPKRFMLGSDAVGRFGNIGKALHAYNPFLDALNEATAHQVARDNFLALLPKQAATLPYTGDKTKTIADEDDDL
ncbi:MAG: 5-oxo-L-prolinase [Gammaproteobacteria bacterium HGW-Gammaproteobacteria-10]|nr:MAG: 5-oxo-L-prolinase [Gammaproteobacteria bacterium HGW-Gammaproteobacteria-10]